MEGLRMEGSSNPPPPLVGRPGAVTVSSEQARPGPSLSVSEIIPQVLRHPGVPGISPVSQEGTAPAGSVSWSQTPS